LEIEGICRHGFKAGSGGVGVWAAEDDRELFKAMAFVLQVNKYPDDHGKMVNT
jgi:hypothetical protein